MKLKNKRTLLLVSSAFASSVAIVAASAACNNPTQDNPTNPEQPGTNPGQPGTNPDQPGTNPQNPSGSEEKDLEVTFVPNSSTSTEKESNWVGSEKFSQWARAKIYNEVNNHSYSISAFPYDNSLISGKSSTWETMINSGYLINYSYSGQSKIKTITTILDDGFSTKSQRYVLTPVTRKIKLTLADAIILMVPDENGNLVEHVFDSDEAELMPSPNKELIQADGTKIKFYSSQMVNAKSNNPKSVNSDEFNNLINKAKSIRFRIRPNQYWVDNKGNKTPYKITADDFYYGYQRTLFYTTTFRRQNGGSEELDNDFKALIQSPGKIFDPNTTYENGYILGLFNINADELSDKNKTVMNDENGNSYFVVNALSDDSSKTLFSSFIDSLTEDLSFVPFPHEYALAKASDPVIVSQNAGKEKEIAKLKNELKDVQGLAKDLAYYWYGTSAENTLFAGPYYAEGFDPADQTDKYHINTHYFDKEFVNSPTSVQTVRQTYTNNPVSEKALAQQQFFDFQNGLSPRLSLQGMSDQNKLIINNNPELYPLGYYKIVSVDSILKYYVFNFTPDKPAGTPSEPYYNDAYAKLMWNTTTDAINNGTAVSADTLEASTVGMGAEFRSLLDLAIVWKKYANALSAPRKSNVWSVGFAPDNKIKAFGPEDTNTLRDHAEDVNVLYGVDSQTGSRINFEIGDGKSVSEWNLNKITFADSSNADAYKSKLYDSVKARMKSLLDKFYAENPQLNGEKVKFVLPVRIPAGYTGVVSATYDSIVKTWNSLDDRIEVKVIDKPQLFDSLLNNYRTSPVFKFVSWSYDYNGIGSGLDGFSNLGLLLMFSEASVNPAYMAKLNVIYPEIAKAAVAFKAYIDNPANEVKLSVPFEKWPTLFSNDAYQLSSHLVGNKYSETTENHLTPIDYSKDDFTSPYSVSAKFWLSYQKSHSIDELIELAKEFSTLYGIIPDSANYSSTDLFSTIAQNPNYEYPTVTNQTVPMQDIKIRNVEK